MADFDHQESPYTQTRTQKSPNRQSIPINFRNNYSAHSHGSNVQIEYLRHRQQSKRQMDAYLKQIQILKEELFRKNEQIQYLKENAIMGLKGDLNNAQRENIKNFKQIEKQSRELQKLRADNFNMQQDLQKHTKDRRQYFSKLQELKQTQQNTKRQIMVKEKSIRTYSQQNKKLQKQLSACRMEIQDLTEENIEKQKRLFESESEYKSILQKIFVTESELKSLQLRQRDNQMMVNTYRQKIQDLERQRQQMMQRIEDRSHSPPESDREPEQVDQIKSLMEQVLNLVDDKKNENKGIQKKFLASIACLNKALVRK